MAGGTIVNLRGLPQVRPAFELPSGGPRVGGSGPDGVGGAPGLGTQGASKPFESFLAEQIQQVNQVQQEADTAVAAVTTGRSQNLHEMMIALDKADVSFRMLTKVRNKCVEAYQEVMRMSI